MEPSDELNEQDIPILEDIVTYEDILAESQLLVNEDTAISATESEQLDIMLLTERVRLAIKPIIEDTVVRALDKTRDQLVDELTSTFNHQLEHEIARAIADQRHARGDLDAKIEDL